VAEPAGGAAGRGPLQLSSLVSDLLGASARRLLKALGEGEADAAALAALADYGWRAPSEQWRDALGACQELDPVYRRLLKAALEELELLEKPMGRLDQEVAELLRSHQDQVQRLAEVAGLGVDSAQPIMAAVGATAATFPSEKGLSSWVGAWAFSSLPMAFDPSPERSGPQQIKTSDSTAASLPASIRRQKPFDPRHRTSVASVIGQHSVVEIIY